MDIVYIVGNGSKWSDNELRLSLRSLEKNLVNGKKIWIVGHKPDWLQDVDHVPMADSYNAPDKNIAAKLLAAAETKAISPNFLYMNDDIFLLQTLDLKAKPEYYHRNELNSTRTDLYGDMLRASHIAHEKRELEPLNFDNHIPIVINKTKLKKAFAAFDWEQSERGYATKSMYCNFNKIAGVQAEDVKINKALDKQEIEQKTHEQQWLSVSDAALNKELKAYLFDLFPNISAYEKHLPKLNFKPLPEIVLFLHNSLGKIKLPLPAAKNLQQKGYGNIIS